MLQHTARSARFLFALQLSALAACSSGSGSPTPYPYEPSTTNVIGSTSTDGAAAHAPSPVGVSSVGTFATPSSSDGCIDLEGQCLKPQMDCAAEDATADVIVGPDGAKLSVICYPNHNYTVVTMSDAPGMSPPLGNNTVLVLDDQNDGVDVEGDLKITGNNAIVYGAGPDVSVIGGNLAIEKNNAIVRGVRIQGETSISKNNASLIDCVIEGDLKITGNNVNLALCEIWGKVSIDGENTVFVSNLVLGDQAISGGNLRCNDNHRFTDGNADHIVQASEIGAPVSCDSSKK